MTSDLLSVAAKRVYYLDQSQKLLARNIANSDTPGYTPRVARPFGQMLDRGGQGALFSTPGNDLEPVSGTISGAAVQSVGARAPDGNAVSMNGELAAVARTQIDQQYAVNIYKSYIGMFTTALGPNP